MHLNISRQCSAGLTATDLTERRRFQEHRQVEALTHAQHTGRKPQYQNPVQAQAQVVGRFITTEPKRQQLTKLFLPGALGNQCDEKVHFPESIDSPHAVHST